MIDEAKNGSNNLKVGLAGGGASALGSQVGIIVAAIFHVSGTDKPLFDAIVGVCTVLCTAFAIYLSQALTQRNHKHHKDHEEAPKAP